MVVARNSVAVFSCQTISQIYVSGENGLSNGSQVKPPSQVSKISERLKGLAKELDIPIIALAQLNRDVEKRADKTPMLSDLRDSGAIEQNADIVIFIHRPEYYGITEDENGNSFVNVILLIWAKHRHGKVGVMRLFKNNSYSEIYERDKSEDMLYSEPEQKEAF